jgi:CheY-like chemotaxis protein
MLQAIQDLLVRVLTGVVFANANTGGQPREGRHMARILVVDDEQQIRLMLRQMLERLGHVVAEAAGGNQAVRSYREDPADIVIMDLIMPDKEGIETITEIRRDYPDARIVAMSGGGRMGPDNYLELASRLGAQRTLAKPFSMGDIQEVIEDLLKTP